MTAHATALPPSHTSIAAQLAQLPHLPMENLWALWDDFFEQRPNHHQERAFGGLSPAARRRLEKIGETGIVPNLSHREANRLLPGTVLTREYDGVEHQVSVRSPGDFEYAGRRYKSLSAIARAITGTQWSGPAFFGLKNTARKGGEA